MLYVNVREFDPKESTALKLFTETLKTRLGYWRQGIARPRPPGQSSIHKMLCDVKGPQGSCAGASYINVTDSLLTAAKEFKFWRKRHVVLVIDGVNLVAKKDPESLFVLQEFAQVRKTKHSLYAL